MNGVVIANTPIAVDCWKTRQKSHVRLFFLTHMHSDHTVGLTSTWKHPIYCSPITGKLLHHKLQVNQNLIRPLELGMSHKINLDELGVETMTVTLIDANHCPGSVMFLFEGYFGTILYTGDFRYSPEMVRQPPLSNNKRIDILYLDNTNCNPDYILPSRQDATEQIKDIIASHPDHDVVIGLYSIGKESLLVELAKEFQTWIVVSPEKLDLLHLLELEDVFTSVEGAGRIRVIEQSAINYANLMRWNQAQPTIAILPTSRPALKWHKNMHVVPYSDHSSFQELLAFVEELKPCSLEPVVKNQSCKMYFKDYLSSPKKMLLKVKVPVSVQAFMRDPSRRVSSEGRKISRRLILPASRQIHKGVVFESPKKGAPCLEDICSPVENQEQAPKVYMDGASSPKRDYLKRPMPYDQKAKSCLEGNCNNKKHPLQLTHDMVYSSSPSDHSTPEIPQDKNVSSSYSKNDLLSWLTNISPAENTGKTMLDPLPLSPPKVLTDESIACNVVTENNILSSLNIKGVSGKERTTTDNHLFNVHQSCGARTPAKQEGMCSVGSSFNISDGSAHKQPEDQFPLVPLNKMIKYSAEQFHRAVENYFEKLKGPPSNSVTELSFGKETIIHDCVACEHHSMCTV
ncbi:5' exonuclease Apollo-like [Ambystoma mexicanum]|uniref:5' exonuclease Apollo-like n=1 Tax=Ambystoma mexicanum TaxID=8296 RepID=UPI0037E8AF6E